MGRKKDDSCYQKAGANEMLFVLRAQDVTAPRHVLLWLADNIENISNTRAREAFECALTMKDEGNNGVRRPAS